MNSDYKVGDLIYDANIYDGMNTSMDDLQFYKRWLPKNKDARILELCCGTGRLTLPIAKDGALKQCNQPHLYHIHPLQ